MEFSGSGISDTCVLWMRHDGVLSRYSDYLGDMTYRHIGSWSPAPPAANTTSSVILSLHVPVGYRKCTFCNSSRMNQTSFNKLFQYQSDAAVTAMCLRLKTKDNYGIFELNLGSMDLVAHNICQMLKGQGHCHSHLYVGHLVVWAAGALQ